MTRDIAGTDEVTVSLPGDATTTAIVDTLATQYPGLAEWKKYLRVAVNLKYAADGATVAQGDEVALIPPVSGG